MCKDLLKNIHELNLGEKVCVQKWSGCLDKTDTHGFYCTGTLSKILAKHIILLFAIISILLSLRIFFYKYKHKFNIKY